MCAHLNILYYIGTYNIFIYYEKKPSNQNIVFNHISRCPKPNSCFFYPNLRRQGVYYGISTRIHAYIYTL